MDESRNAGPCGGTWPPDWRDEKEYPSELEPEQWAWEFVRRNPDYQRSCANAVADWKRRQDPEYVEAERRAALKALGVGDPVDKPPMARPKWTAEDSAFMFRLFCLRESKKWGLVEFIEPARSLSPDEARGMFIALPSERHYLHVPGTLVPLSMLHEEPSLTKEHVAAADLIAAAILDLGQPVDWQLAKVGAEAKREQERLKSRGLVRGDPPTAKFPDLREALRVLDAWAEEEARRATKAEGWQQWFWAHRREVARVLFPGYCPRRELEQWRGLWKDATGRVSDALYRAKKLLRPEKYLALIERQRTKP